MAVEVGEDMMQQPVSHDLVSFLSQMHPIPAHVSIWIPAPLNSTISTHSTHIVIVFPSNPTASPFRIKP